MRGPRFPQFPSPARIKDKHTARILDAAKQIIETLTGIRGSPLDRAVTFRDLKGSPISDISVSGGGPPVITPPSPPTGPAPTALSNLQASGAFENIILTWEGINQINYGHTELWRSSEDNLGTAVMVATSVAAVYADHVGSARVYYYWVRAISLAGVSGPFNATAGTKGETQASTDIILGELQGQIDESELSGELNSRIDLIDGPSSLAGSVADRISAEAQARADAVSAEALTRAQAVSGEAQARESLAQQLRGDYPGSNLTLLTSGLLFDESQARANDISQEVQDRNAAILVETNDRIAAVSQEASDRANAISAEASARGAAITNEQTIRQNADDSLASDISTNTAAIGNNTAAIQSEATARANADSAETIARETLASQIRGTYSGSNLGELTSGLLYQERTTRVVKDDALAQQMTLLSAGVGEQFDYVSIWYFNSSVEGWSGNGAPSVNLGWLRPANATGEYVTSPTGLAVDANQYSQIRLRIRKSGSPTWAGKLWWKHPGDPSWITAQSVALTEPDYDTNNIGQVLVDAGWEGTIDQIRIDTSADQTAANYFEYDWIAIGRPSPGASSSALLDLSAHVTQNDGLISENSQAITTLQGDVSANTGAIQGHTTAISGIQIDITSNENSIQSNAQDITSLLNTVNDPANGVAANAQAIDTLTTQIIADEGTITSQGSAITSLQNSVSTNTGDIQGNTTAISGLTTRVTDNEGQITAQSEDLTQVKAKIGASIHNGGFERGADGLSGAPEGWLLDASGGGSGNIQAGQVFFIPGTHATGGEPNQVAISRNSRYLYVANNASPSSVSGYEIDVFNGALTELTGSPWATGAGGAFDLVATDDLLFVSNADVGNGGLAAYQIGNDGTLTPFSGSPFFTATAFTGVSAWRGKLIACDITHNRVHLYDASGNTLTEIDSSTTGTLPYDVTVTGNRAYVANKSGQSITGYDLTFTALTSFGTLNVAGACNAIEAMGEQVYVSAPNAASQSYIAGYTVDTVGTFTAIPTSPWAVSGPAQTVRIHPSGRFVYATINATEEIATFERAANGSLTPIATGAVTASGAQGLACTPDGLRLYGTNLADDQVYGFSIVAADGAIGALLQYQDKPRPGSSGQLSYGSEDFAPSGYGVGSWALGKRFALGAGGGALRVSTWVELLTNTTAWNGERTDSETFLSEADAFIEIKAFDSNGSELTFPDHISTTASDQDFSARGPDSGRYWVPLSHGVVLPVAATHIEIWLVTSDGNNTVQPLGTRTGNSAVLLDDCEITYAPGLAELYGTDLTPQVAANASAITVTQALVTQHGDDITGLTSRTTTLEGGLTTAVGDISANTSALDTLSGTVTAHGNEIDAHSQAITAVQNAINDNETGLGALSTALSGLTSEVHINENSITANSSAITALDNAVNDPASGLGAVNAALSALSSTVSSNSGEITAATNAITDLQSQLSNDEQQILAHSNAIDALNTTVTQNENDISANASDITSLQTTVAGIGATAGANASAIEGLSTDVSNINGEITSQGESITDLENHVGTLVSLVKDPVFEHGGEFWTGSSSGSPAGPPFTGGTLVTGVGQNGGNVLEITGNPALFSTKLIPVQTDHTYRVSFRVRQTVDDPNGNSKVYAGVETYDADKNKITTPPGTYRYCGVNGHILTVAEGWQTFEGEITGVAPNHHAFRAGTVYVRVLCIANSPTGAGTAQLDTLDIHDITQSAANASAISVLSTEVQDHGDVLSSQSQSITSLQNSLDTTNQDVSGVEQSAAANASAITSLTTRVTDNEGDISSQAGQITRLKVTQTVGDNLVVNGFSELGDNTNFNDFTYVTDSDAPGGAAFESTGVFNSKFTTGLIPVDPTRQYKLSGSVKQVSGAQASFWLGLLCLDSEALIIRGDEGTSNCYAGTDTTLSADAHVGDMQVTLTSAANWQNATNVGFYIAFDTSPDFSDLPNHNLAQITDPWTASTTVTLAQPLDRDWPAGTNVRQMDFQNYIYIAASNELEPATYQEFSGITTGHQTDPTVFTGNTVFPIGTAYVRIVFLVNRTDDETAATTRLAGVSLKPLMGEGDVTTGISVMLDQTGLNATAITQLQGDFQNASGRITDIEDLTLSPDSALATKLSQISTTLNGNTATIQTHAVSIDGLETQYTIKSDVNNYVTGFGLASTTNDDGTHSSAFIVNAGTFGITFPSQQWQSGLALSLGQYVSPSADYPNPPKLYFRALDGGTTGVNEPTWPVSVGDTVTDGGVTFEAITPESRIPFVVGLVGGNPTVGVDADLVISGQFSTERIAARAVTADKINVDELSAVSANMGMVTSGTFKTNASPAPRAEISSVGDFPIWVGSGSKSAVNATFSLDTLGNGRFSGDIYAAHIHESSILPNALNIDCGNGRFATWVVKGQNTELTSDGHNSASIILGDPLIAPDFGSTGLDPKRIIFHKMDVYLEWCVHGDFGPVKLRLDVKYDGGAWTNLSEIEYDCNYRGSISSYGTYTLEDNGWNEVFFRVTTDKNTDSLTGSFTVLNLVESPHPPGTFNDQTVHPPSNSGGNPTRVPVPKNIQNLIFKPDFEDGSRGDWGGSGTYGIVNSGQSEFSKALFHFNPGPDSIADVWETDNTRVYVGNLRGQRVYRSGWISGVGTTVAPRVVVRFERADHSAISWLGPSATAGGGFHFFEGIIIVPNDAVWMLPGFISWHGLPGEHMFIGPQTCSFYTADVKRIKGGANVTAGALSGHWAGYALSATQTSIGWSGGTLHVQGETISYSSHTWSGLSAGAHYYLSIDDIELDGVPSAYHADPNADSWTASPDRIAIPGSTGSWVPTLDSSGGGGPSGGGGWDSCVTADMWVLLASGSYKRARDIKFGDMLAAWDRGKPVEGGLPVRNDPTVVPEEAMIVEADEAVLTCSCTTPFDDQDEGILTGLEIDRRAVHTYRYRWTKCSAQSIGVRDVVYISLGGYAFAAGLDKDRWIVSHNPIETQKP